jgi:hypothetical protein
MTSSEQINPVETEPKPFQIEIISDLDEILELEIARCMFYLARYEDYNAKGYSKMLRFPEGISPEAGDEVDQIAVRGVVTKEVKANTNMYKHFDQIFETAIAGVEQCIPIAEELYGFKVRGLYRVAPTAYGTGASPQDPIHFRLPELLPESAGQGFTTGKYRTPIETLIHEIVAHKATAFVREGTAIEDSIKCTHQRHKEHLMDLLGRTVLVRSGIMQCEEVAMQVRSQNEASHELQNHYYGNSTSEFNLPWDGDLERLVAEIISDLEDRI